MKRDATIYLQATIFVNEDSSTRDIRRIENLTETEARAIRDAWMDDPGAKVLELARAEKAEERVMELEALIVRRAEFPLSSWTEEEIVGSRWYSDLAAEARTILRARQEQKEGSRG